MLNLEFFYISGLPISLDYNLGVIHQPTIKDIISFGISVEDILQPFVIRLDTIDLNQDGITEIRQQLKDFDLFFLQMVEKDNDEDTFIGKLIRSFKILYKTNNIKLIYDEQIIIIDDKYEINRNNFTVLADVVLEMFNTEKPVKKDNSPKYKDKARQKIWEKLEKKRQEDAKKKAFTLADIINVVVHIDGYISYSDVCDMTYFQLLNTYSTLLTKSNYDEYFAYKSSGQFQLKQDIPHWATNSKVKKSVLTEHFNK